MKELISRRPMRFGYKKSQRKKDKRNKIPNIPNNLTVPLSRMALHQHMLPARMAILRW